MNQLVVFKDNIKRTSSNLKMRKMKNYSTKININEVKLIII